VSGPAWLAFLVAAGVGAPARYLVDEWVQHRIGGAFPWGTFVVNVSGCFVVGVITGLALYHGLGTTSRTVLGTGGLGAYTTFSTFTFETVRLAEDGAVETAARNVVASLLLGLAAASLGLALTAVV
jgi:CrcB protein